MAITTRQTGLLVAEDWTKVYQTFRNADFQSYDYETLRKTMVDYLRLYYPEDFNDFIESSEFIALIDSIAFLGQSLAFRGDLNARENFIDTAERRDSILKLARLISYNPKRNTPASGFLKFDSVSTTETVYDSDGINLSGLVITWNDAANDNWLEQFTVILNAALVDSQVIGKPSNTQTINGIVNAEYQINLNSSPTAVSPFTAQIEGIDMRFEALSSTSVDAERLYEVAPKPDSPFNIIYKNDGLGNASANTGFFFYFKQGELRAQDFTFNESIPNRVYSVDTNNINNSDVWLYKLDRDLNISTEWQKVSTVNGTNVIYNKSITRDLCQVVSRAGDQIDLVFGDGGFSSIPQGDFRLYYRISNGLAYKITPDEMQGVIISLDYVSRSGRVETLNISASLQYTIANSSPRETPEEIKQKAPQQYYTQDRMVTGEDYNILPYTLFNNVLKAKAVNRTSSGVSRYLDVIDSTGKYSSTNIFADDGLIYRETVENTFSFDYNTRSDIFRVLLNQIAPILRKQETKQFFYDQYPVIPLTGYYWTQSTSISNGATGYFIDQLNPDGLEKILQVGTTTSSNAKFINQGAIIKFSPGSGNYFDSRNRIKPGTPSLPGDKRYIYAAVITLVGDGTNSGQGNLLNGTGPIVINEQVPTGAEIVSVFPALVTELPQTVINQAVDYVESFEEFGIRYDSAAAAWTIITPQNLNIGKFDLSNAGNITNEQLDSSWIIRFKTSGQAYTVYYRGLNYVFESVRETNFYFDDQVKVFDPVTGLTINDQIKILKVNSIPDGNAALGLDYVWYVYDNIVDVDGYSNPSKIKITFPDSDNDGIPDNPELFDLVVSPDTDTDRKYVYFRDTFGYDNFVVKTPVDSALINSEYNTLADINQDRTTFSNGQLFYIPDQNIFYQLSVSNSVYTLNQVFDYTAKVGRQGLYFQYRHNSPNYRRIDPSPNNIIDLYLLTKQYADDYVDWIQDTSATIAQPPVPSAQELLLEFNSLEQYKSVTDTIIYNAAKFKPIFGSKAPSELRAIFKVVKNPNVVISDNEIKTSLIAAVNNYFSVANWEFGETFYFSELSAYLHSTLAPNVASIIIVPESETDKFGGLLQINAEYNEIIISAATVDNVQVIPAITLNQLNRNIDN